MGFCGILWDSGAAYVFCFAGYKNACYNRRYGIRNEAAEAKRHFFSGVWWPVAGNQVSFFDGGHCAWRFVPLFFDDDGGVRTDFVEDSADVCGSGHVHYDLCADNSEPLSADSDGVQADGKAFP